MNKHSPVILVVENDSIQRDLITLALNRLGCKVSTVSGGTEALAFCQKNLPRVILLDLFLPQMSGLEVISRLQDNGQLCQTTVVVITSFGFPEIVEQAKSLGAYDFIIKPFEAEDLVQRVKRALERRKSL